MSRGEELRALLLVVVIMCVPTFGGLWMILSTTEADLSDLTPRRQFVKNHLMLGWPALRRDHAHELGAGATVQALGYMMDDHPIGTGDLVYEFILLPEPGNLLHPAHRLEDQMIEVHLCGSDPIRFSPRSLVWVWGVLHDAPGTPEGSKALYRLDQSRAQMARREEIQEYFK